MDKYSRDKEHEKGKPEKEHLAIKAQKPGSDDNQEEIPSIH